MLQTMLPASESRGLVTFRLDGSAAIEHNGANGVVILLLFEGGAETVHTDIAVEEERAGVVSDGVSVRVDEGRRCGQLSEQLPHNGFHGTGKDKVCLLYTSPSPRDQRGSRMPSSA